MEESVEPTVPSPELEAERAKSRDYYDQLLRLKAEFENFRKRTDREKADARRWGKEELVLRLVSLMDVLEQAEASAHAGADLKAVITGLDMLYKEFKRLLKDEGLEEVPSETFDPAVHEALEIVEQEGAPGRILGVFQRGYRFAGALLRPARVKVSKELPAFSDQLPEKTQKSPESD